MKETHSPRLQKQFETYSAFHKSDGNRICHIIGIPLIMISAFGLLSQFVVNLSDDSSQVWFRLDGGLFLWLLAMSFYLFLDWRIAIPFGLFALGLHLLGRSFPLPWLWVFFVLGWIFQFIGHYWFERRSPAFLTNLVHLLVGPIWVFAELIGYRVIK